MQPSSHRSHKCVASFVAYAKTNCLFRCASVEYDFFSLGMGKKSAMRALRPQSKILLCLLWAAALMVPTTGSSQIIFDDGFEVVFALTVNKTGSGSGTVTSNPSGISCGTQCAHNFTAGTSVAATSAALAQSTFTGWSGACGGEATTCNVVMSGPRLLSADFIFTGSDPFNCGMPGTQCANSQICSSSTCVCRPGLTLSDGGTCVDLQTDPRNCGMLDLTCGGSANRCLNGVCQTSCGSLLQCGGAQSLFACVNPASDPLNCGGCGNRCGTGEACISGTCQIYAF